jgi:hypothetical protein
MPKKSSFYRSRRASQGCKRVEAILSPEAVRALRKLTSGGIPQSLAIQKAIIEAAKRKPG